LFSLPYVGLFPAVAQHNFGIDERSSTYKWLYATWGLGAAIGGLAIGTFLVAIDKRRLIRLGFGAFAVTLAAFGLVRSPVGAFLVAPLLGFAYFGTTTSMNTIFQARLEDHERGRAMSLWFMAFGGTVPLGNLIFGPVVDSIGARQVLVGGAIFALVLAWWCNIAGIDHRVARASAAQRSGDPLEPD
ncbi:MAG: MFS transporter, partial [Ilumatobacter sp.]|nr:MFS transporter [Ilumatobacter sp.]